MLGAQSGENFVWERMCESVRLLPVCTCGINRLWLTGWVALHQNQSQTKAPISNGFLLLSYLDSCWLCSRPTHGVLIHLYLPAVFLCLSMSMIMPVCTKWGGAFHSDHLRRSIPPFTTLYPYLVHPFLIAECMLGWDWFIPGFLNFNTPSGIYLVHAKLKLIHISLQLLWSWCPHWSVCQSAKRKVARVAYFAHPPFPRWHRDKWGLEKY